MSTGFGSHPCLHCHRPQDDVVHGPEREPRHGEEGRIAHHLYDPGERRHLVRRQEDRIALVERRFRAVNG